MAFRETLDANIITFSPYTVANAPDATAYAGSMIYVSNGAAGAPVMAFSDGTNWLRVDTYLVITAA